MARITSDCGALRSLQHGNDPDNLGMCACRYIQSLLQKTVVGYRGDITVLSAQEEAHGNTFTDSVVIEYVVRRSDDMPHLMAVTDLLQSEALVKTAMVTANLLTDHTVVSACVRGKVCAPPPGTESVTHAMTLADHDLVRERKTQPFLALLLRFCQRLMPLRGVAADVDAAGDRRARGLREELRQRYGGANGHLSAADRYQWRAVRLGACQPTLFLQILDT